MSFEGQATPVVSVVMAVCDRPDVVDRTLRSLQGEENAAVEIIVVNDGSGDETAALLDRWQAERPNRRVIHQSNQGLTASLITGCALASGSYIARQDAGDESLPGRLQQLRAVLDADDGVVMVSSGARFVDADGDTLYEVLMTDDMAMNGLTTLTPDGLKGPPHHGSVMFRSDTYRAVGGYRAAFYVAQDLDLWTRLVERGRHVSLPAILYQADASPGAISFTRSALQEAAVDLICQASSQRQSGRSEQKVLEAASRTTRSAPNPGPRSHSAYHYFIGSCLRRSRPDKAREHFRQAIRFSPLNLRAWIRWLQCRLRV